MELQHCQAWLQRQTQVQLQDRLQKYPCGCPFSSQRRRTPSLSLQTKASGTLMALGVSASSLTVKGEQVMGLQHHPAQLWTRWGSQGCRQRSRRKSQTRPWTDLKEVRKTFRHINPADLTKLTTQIKFPQSKKTWYTFCTKGGGPQELQRSHRSI